MEIRESNFENFGEVDCQARMKVLHIKATGALPMYSLSIRQVGKDQFQAYGKFAQPMLLIQGDNGHTINVEEVVLKEGKLIDVVAFTNQMTGMKDTVTKSPPEEDEEHINVCARCEEPLEDGKRICDCPPVEVDIPEDEEKSKD